MKSPRAGEGHEGAALLPRRVPGQCLPPIDRGCPRNQCFAVLRSPGLASEMLAISARRMSAALIFAAMLLSSPADAVTTIPIWHGPGANPCAGQCSLAWALDRMQGHVPPRVLARLRHLVRTDTPMHRLHVLDGDLIAEMGEGGPHMIHAPMRASLILPEPMMGWRVGSYIFGVIDRCQNPVLILRPVEQAATPITVPTYEPVTRAPIITASAGATSLGWWRAGASVVVDTDDCACLDTPGEMPPPVPLPAPVWTLLAALAGLGWLKWRTT